MGLITNDPTESMRTRYGRQRKGERHIDQQADNYIEHTF